MFIISNNVVSYNIGENVLFDKITPGENFLILYNGTNNYKHIIRNFMRYSANDNSILFYVCHTKNKINFDFKMRNFFFNIINEETILKLKDQLSKSFNETEKQNKDMFLILDWSMVRMDDCMIFLPFLKNLIKISKSKTPSGWKRKYKTKIQKPFPLKIINIMETTNLKSKFLQEIISLHKRIYYLQNDFNVFMMPNISPSLETIFPKHHVLPLDILEKTVKDNLELIALLFLEKESKSGYQVLKEIAQNFHCILSQGTLYPLLYHLEKENKIAKQNGKGREVIYSLTKKTRDELQQRKETSLRAYQHLASFFEMGAMGKKIEKNLFQKTKIN